MLASFSLSLFTIISVAILLVLKSTVSLDICPGLCVVLRRARVVFAHTSAMLDVMQAVENLTEADWEVRAGKYHESAMDSQTEFEVNNSRAHKLAERSRASASRSSHLQYQAEVQAMGYKFLLDSASASDDAAKQALLLDGLVCCFDV